MSANIITGFLDLPYILIILILSTIATLITTLIQKYLTDQKKIKAIKKEMKQLKEQQKKHRDDSKKLMAIQKEMLQKNMDIMKQSFKTMMYTFIPLILFFSWMSANIAYQPINPEQEFTITLTISQSYPYELNTINITSVPPLNFTLNPAHTPKKETLREIQYKTQAEKPGIYTILIESPTFKHTHEILISQDKKYTQPEQPIKNSQLRKIVTGNQKVQPFQEIGIPLKTNWLWTYILISVLLSLGLRKILDVA